MTLWWWNNIPWDALQPNNEFFDKIKNRWKYNPTSTEYPQEIYNNVIDAITKWIFIGHKNVFTLSQTQKQNITLLLDNADHKDIIRHIISNIIQLQNLCRLQSSTPDKDFEKEITKQQQEIQKILKAPITKKLIKNKPSIDMKKSDYECVNFLQWEYPFLTLSSWIFQLPDNLHTTLWKELKMWIEPNDHLVNEIFMNNNKDNYYRQLVLQYVDLSIKTNDYLHQVIRTVVNAPINHLPVIDKWKDFFVHYFMYIYHNWVLAELWNTNRQLPQYQQKVIYDFKTALEKAFWWNHQKEISILEQQLHRIYKKASHDNIDMVDLLYDIHTNIKAKQQHYKGMKHIYGSNNYYEINQIFHKETQELLFENIISVPENELGDEARFMWHSYFDKDQTIRLFENTVQAIWHLHKKEKQILEMFKAIW